MKTKSILLFTLFTFSSCYCQKVIISGKEKIRMERKEFETIIQTAINFNHIDFFYEDIEKENGLIIVINDFIKSYYKDLSLRKFDKEVLFKNHKEIYYKKNQKFIDIMKPFKVNDTLHIMYGLRFENYAVEAKFIKDKSSWKLINKNSVLTERPVSTYHFKTDKEQCLVEQIESTVYGRIEKCSKYDFLR